jgi:hypothetical protein
VKLDYYIFQALRRRLAVFFQQPLDFAAPAEIQIFVIKARYNASTSCPLSDE